MKTICTIASGRWSLREPGLLHVLPVLLGEQPDSDPVRTYTLHQTNTLALGIRHGKWKYLDHPSSGGNDYGREPLKSYALPDEPKGVPGQLYDLVNDPGETTNLYLKHPERVEALLNQLHLYRDSAPAGGQLSSQTYRFRSSATMHDPATCLQFSIIQANLVSTMSDEEEFQAVRLDIACWLSANSGWQRAT